MDAAIETEGAEYISLGGGGSPIDALVHLLDRVAQSQGSLGMKGVLALCVRSPVHDVYGVVRFEERAHARITDGVPEDCDAIMTVPAALLVGEGGEKEEVKVAGDRALIRRFTETFLQPKNPLTLRFMR